MGARRFTNNQNIPLPLAVWLTYHEYDFRGGKNRISATSLLKSTRQFILSSRVPLSERVNDIADFISSKMGSAFHDSIERAWENGYKEGLDALGYSQKQIDRVRINPTEPEAGTIPVHLELRGERKIGDWTVSGKFDMSIEGELYDTKSTSVYAYILGSKDQDYIKQGSIYRWIHPDILTGDHIHIQHIFTDYSKAMARQRSDYPPSKLMNYTLPLMSLDETEEFVGNKIKEIEHYFDKPEEELPFCTDKELWRSEASFKYYANPEKMGKATKVFDTLAEANAHLAEKGKGVVLTFPGQVRACAYCPGFVKCTQKDGLNHA